MAKGVCPTGTHPEINREVLMVQARERPDPAVSLWQQRWGGAETVPQSQRGESHLIR